jgi:hypothetical protein
MYLRSAMTILALSAFGQAAEFPAPATLPSQKELPNPLVFLDGKKVEHPSDWTTKRVPELKALFQHYMYGTLPAVPSSIQYRLKTYSDKAFNGKATISEVTILPFAKGNEDGPAIRMLLAVPNKRAGKVPCFVGPNFSGNHTLVDEEVAIPTGWIYDKYPGVQKNRATAEGRGKLKDVWNIEGSIDRGYAVATFYNGDVDPDQAKERGGIRPYLPADLETSTIACWAWGVSRCVDSLLKNDAIDPKKIIAVGHSRLGKTVLLATAFDDRIAAAIPLQAGCGGTAPSRGKVGESVTRINSSFPHWFNANFKQFGSDPSKIPFDQNCLVALCAPRPVLFANAQEDEWANPKGQFDVLLAADPVYRFLGVEGLEAKEMPPLNHLVNSRLGYFIRPGKHSMSLVDWQAFWDFADKQLGK